MGRFLLFAFLLLFVSACAGVAGLEALTGAGPEAQYQEVLEEWTKKARVYSGFETELFVCATFRSLPLRAAYITEYARIYGLAPMETQKLETDQTTAYESSLDFVMAAYVPNEKQNDFSHARSHWSLVLENDAGSRSRPLEVLPLPAREGVAKHFYPYFTPWKRAYLVRFPHRALGGQKDFLTDETQSLTLIVRSPMAATQLTWDRPESGWGQALTHDSAMAE